MAEDAHESEFLAALDESGGSSGNLKLRRKLGWSEELYDAVKAALIDAGRIAPGRGRGGSVRKVDSRVQGDPDAYLAENVFWAPKDALWA